MTTHDLKVWPEFFGPIERGEKLFELRRDDRDFKVGDWLKLREWKPADIEAAQPSCYTGARVMRRIAYVLEAESTERLIHRSDLPLEKGALLRSGYVLLGLAPPISELPCKLQGHRLFVEGVDPAIARVAGEYLIDLTAFVNRVKAEADENRRAAARCITIGDAKNQIGLDGKQVLDFEFKVSEEDRQAIVLALAMLARERPGWEQYLSGIAADRLGSDLLFGNVLATLKSTAKIGSAP